MTFRNAKYSNQTIEYYNKGVDSKKKKGRKPKIHHRLDLLRLVKQNTIRNWKNMAAYGS